MKKILQYILKFFAKRIIKKYHPKVIGITGSVGKTTTKDFVATILEGEFSIRSSQKNYNNEIGVPLTIIGAEAAGKSLAKWLKIFWSAILLLFKKDKNYPEILILEMGADKPGDFDYLNSIVTADIGIITNVGHSHMENFGSVERIRKEKSKLITNLHKGGTAIINIDNDESKKILNVSKVKTMTFGFDQKAAIRAIEPQFKIDVVGEKIELKTVFKISANGSFIPIVLENSLGKARIYAVLAASGVAVSMGMNLLNVSMRLKNFVAPKGRLNFILGRNSSILVDDTYNSSPESVIEAINTLNYASMPTGARRIAVMGDMLELGNYEKEGHELVGEYLINSKYDYIVTIGKSAKIIYEHVSKMPDKNAVIMHFENQDDLIKYVENILNPADIVLIKGSQGARMEKIVKALMKYTDNADNVLVRQTKEWN